MPKPLESFQKGPRRLRLISFSLFIIGIAGLFAGAAFQASGATLQVVLYLSLFLIACAAALFVAGWVRAFLSTEERQ
ncbi:hypothetical protein [Xanthomonas campestris]|uniref:hypothetical protein n=1 Tax=Xanthomonas campestris TaxID=339 RepID=UPI0023674B4F|nr:hypothetical protein [Xanthomonas campestris]WDJ87450.1 hypothetical protein JH279_22135 [Xanthomonas campestris pv. incanae]WDJ96218.1 hypothetical protein JH260_21700 [Xanthomonas campestris pv. incanae]